MTAQISDTFHYRNQRFDLAGIKGEGLFDPAEHGMEPQGICSACWRGYCCHYLVDEQRLILHAFEVSLSRLAENPDDPPIPVLPPVLNGVAGVKPGDEEFSFLEYRYEDVDLTVPFTGGLLLAKGFIRDLYDHMGFHPAWKFETVYELIFDEGRLTEERDVSERLAEVRQRMLDQPPTIDPADPIGSRLAWIEDCFSLDYEL